MADNQDRRLARRQKRGLLRVEEILSAAGALFAEHGYDRVTINMIAAHAGISQGSLYQFFPNKEAITQAFAANAIEQLHRVYDMMLSPEGPTLPFQMFLETFIDRIVAFNRNCPGYLALELGLPTSSPPATALADVRQGLLARQDALLAAYWPQSTREQRQLPLLVSYRVFLALLPLALRGDQEQQEAIVQEMKAVLYRYLEPIVSEQTADKGLSVQMRHEGTSEQG